MSNEIISVHFNIPVKCPFRSNGPADLHKAMGTLDEVSGRAVRKIWFNESGTLLFIEAVSGPHTGQVVTTPSSNVAWARVTHGAAKQEEIAREKKQKGKAA